MTCIVAIKSHEKIYIGGDSAGVAGLSISIRKDPKVFIKYIDNKIPVIFGFTSSFRMGQIIQYVFNIPNIPKDIDIAEYMVKIFIPEIRKVFIDEGYTYIDSNRESGGTFIVGIHNRLFLIENDFQVGEHYDNYIATGCGEYIAYGSLYTTKHSLNPVERINIALSAASYFSGGVSSPFTIKEI